MMGWFIRTFWSSASSWDITLLFFIIYTVLAVMEIMPTAIMYTMTVLIGMMLPMSTFAYDDLARWNKYAAATPAGRRGIVAGQVRILPTCHTGGSGCVRSAADRCGGTEAGAGTLG